jgi:hypothetical protein
MGKMLLNFQCLLALRWVLENWVHAVGQSNRLNLRCLAKVKLPTRQEF